MGEINGAALASVTLGAVFLYGGMVGKSPLAALQAAVQGRAPSAAPTTQAIPLPLPAGPTAPGALLPGEATPAGGAAAIVAAAKSQIGKPYIFNTPASSTDPNPASFDCSGLSMWCYAKAGHTLVHFTGAQYLQTKHRPMAQVQPADLVFFGSLGNIHHVGIYIGGGQMIDAPDVGIPVGYRNMIESDNLHLVGYL